MVHNWRPGVAWKVAMREQRLVIKKKNPAVFESHEEACSRAVVVSGGVWKHTHASPGEYLHRKLRCLLKLVNS